MYKAEVRRLKAEVRHCRNLGVRRQKRRKNPGILAIPGVAHRLQSSDAEPGQRLASTGTSFHL